MRVLLSIALGVVLLATAFSIPAAMPKPEETGFGPTGQGVYYLRNAAYGYSINWWNKSNPHYNYYDGVDCANFVSQCLIAGGMSLWQGTDGAGFGIYADSNGTIPFCDYLHQHLCGYQAIEYTYGVEEVNISIPANMDIGDIVMFGTASGDHFSHAMIVVDVGTSDLTLAAHTTNTSTASFWGVLSGSFTCASFYHIKIEMSEPFAFIVKTGTLNVRAGPATSYQILGTVQQSQMYVAIGTHTDASGNIWYNFWFDERNAWCAANMVSGNEYARPANQVQFEIEVSTSLNVRDGPGTSYTIAGQVFDGMRYAQLGIRNSNGTRWRSFWWSGALKWCSYSYTFNATPIVKNLTRLNVGFYPSWMGSAYTSLKHDLLTHLSWFSVEMDSTGAITNYNSWPSGWSTLVLNCKENGTKVLLTVTLFGSSSVSTFLADPTARVTGIANLLAATIDGNADGIMVDFEYPPSGSDSNLLAFMQELSDAFNGQDLLYEVHLCLMPYPWSSYGFGQLPTINNYVDYYFLMGYDYFYGGSAETGAVGALFWNNNIDAWHAIDIYINNRGVNKSKLVYGIPYFGFDWPVAEAGHDARLADRNGTASSRTYNSAMTKLESTGATLQWDSYSVSPWYYYSESGQWHQVWFDNETSLMFKYQVVNQLDLPGMGIWALAYDNPRIELWNAIDEKVGKFSLVTTPTNGSTVSGVTNITMQAVGGVTDVWVLTPGASWTESVYTTDVHTSYIANFYHLWDTTSLANGWYTVQLRMNNSYGAVSYENRSYYVQNGNTSYVIQLRQGWSLVSVPLVQSNTSLAAVLGSIDGKYDIVQWYNVSDAADCWKTYSTFKPASQNDLSKINHTMGFWLHTTVACDLTAWGNISSSTGIPLKAGWNLVGYPSGTQRTVSTALAGTGYDAVEGFNASAPYRLSALSGLYMMKPGEGYWVHVTMDTTWIINW